MIKVVFLESGNEKEILLEGKQRIKVGNIEYVDYCKPYVVIHCNGNKEFCLRESLVQFEKNVGMPLVRAGKEYLVNLDYIDDILEYVVLKSGKKFKISKAAKSQLKKAYFDYLLNKH